MDTPSQILIGKLAIDRALITQDQLDECLTLQHELQLKGMKLQLGEVLVRKGYVSDSFLDEVQRLQANQDAARDLGGFELIKLLGEGGMGTVYMARERILGRVIALKILSPRLSKDREYIVRFEREAEIAGGGLIGSVYLRDYALCNRQRRLGDSGVAPRQRKAKARRTTFHIVHV